MLENKDIKEERINVLGLTFNTEEERRTHFREELRKKLPELKKMEGFPIGEDEDILNLSDPPYYTACPNPWLNDFIEEWEEEKKELEKKGKRKADFEVSEPYAADISEGKNNPIYRSHSYHTKVPHPAIMHFLKHYTVEGDIVLDGFQGTGMTGVACKALEFEKEIKNLKFVGIDLSPIANFISYNFNINWNLLKIEKQFDDILDKVNNELSWMYQTWDESSKSFARINYVIWSDIYSCPNCNKEDSFWNFAFIKETETVKREFKCPNCSADLKKASLHQVFETKHDYALGKTIKQLKRRPVIIDYTNKFKKRLRKEPDNNDFEILHKIEFFNPTFQYPIYEIVDGDETRRNIKIGITNAHHYYEKRALITLAYLNGLFVKSKDASKLLFFLTSIISMRCTKRMPYRAGGKSAGSVNNMSIPSISQEYNVIDTIKRKYRDIERAKSTIITKTENSLISNQSASDINNIKDNSIDYIFLDPPFGANIMYSELSSLSESWLKIRTNIKDEAIENKSQRKGKQEYQSIIDSSLKEFYRVLKPGKWMTVEFSNTSAAIWNIIQYSIQNSGFIIANVAGIDKKQGSFNAVNTATAVKQDLVISCYKPSSKFHEIFRDNQLSNVATWDFIEEHLNHLTIHIATDNSTTAIIERSPKILFDRLIAFYVQRGLPVPMDAGSFQKGLRERFTERDGMFFTNEQVQEYDKKRAENPEFIHLSLLVSSEQDGVMWLKNILADKPLTYQDIQPLWLQALAGVRKGDIIPELITFLQENFLEDESGKWYAPDPENEADLNELRTKRLLKIFEGYKNETKKPRTKIKEARVEALREGFKQCYQDKDFKTIVTVGDRIPNNLLMEDEVLLQFYDIASSRV
ncbi:MAG: DNA methyltransferase [Dysgonamonadaceae bacterium]|nr:DNA methyltransferase [Dysgonamonadaceae bacterium]MDD4729254.1 DNA methyltransferase [Dysgonamonadaceae bacterium]